MTQSCEKFPGIKKVALEIAYDNGIINRSFTESEFLSKVDEILGSDGVDFVDLKRIDDWIATLTDDEIQILAVGEDVEMTALSCTFSYPEHLEIFNEIFEI